MALLLTIGVGSARAQQPVLAPGSRGPMVADWQRALDRWLDASGYAATRRLRRQLGGGLAADGVFGQRTEQATVRFQREARIEPSGVVDLKTWERWIGANVTCCGAGLPNVGPGDWGGYAGWWQVALGRWLAGQGRSALAVDCAFGPATTEATRLFQRAVHLPASGRADRRTWAALRRLRPGIALP